jgi:hypothetical protein
MRYVACTVEGRVTEEWRKLHNEELNDPYSSPNVVRVLNQEE